MKKQATSFERKKDRGTVACAFFEVPRSYDTFMSFSQNGATDGYISVSSTQFRTEQYNVSY